MRAETALRNAVKGAKESRNDDMQECVRLCPRGRLRTSNVARKGYWGWVAKGMEVGNKGCGVSSEGANQKAECAGEGTA